MGLISYRGLRFGRGLAVASCHGLAVASVALAVSLHPVAAVSAQAQSIDKVISGIFGTPKRSSRVRNTVQRADVVIPPVPVKQPRPWHSETRSHPSTGPEPEWPKVLTPPPTQVASQNQAPTTQPAAQAEAGSAADAVPAPARSPVASTPVVVEDVYTNEEIATAQARCQRLLSRIKAEVIPEFPIKKGECGHPAPVKLVSIGTSPQIAVVPPAIVNCDMVEALHDWLLEDLEPLARKHLGSRIVMLENMSSYSCRNVYGRVNTRLSQHAKANALDIRGFVTAKGRVARLLQDWGPTGRDIEAFQIAQRKAEEARRQALAEAEARAARQAGQAANARGGPAEQSGQGGLPASAMRSTFSDGAGISDGSAGGGTSLGLTDGPNRLGGPVPVPSPRPKGEEADAGLVHQAAAGAEPTPAKTPSARFLKAAHDAACKRFGTVLGPEANNAHRNHFHVDLAPRKGGNFCE